MPNLLAAVKAAEELDKAVGIVAKVVNRLRAQPDVAALKLCQALDEIAKTLQAVDGAAASYLSLAIDTGALEKNSALLLRIESGQLAMEIEQGRGHCHVIGQIYYAYLDKWFSKVLAADEYAAIQEVFSRLGSADQDLFVDLSRIAMTLQAEATAVLDLVVRQQTDEARARVVSSLADLRPLRKAMAGTMQTLYALKNEFADVTAAGV